MANMLLPLLASVLVNVLYYVIHPRAAFAHLVAGALLYHVHRLHGARVAGVIAAVEECMILLLWLLIPNSWSTIISIAVAVYVYEQVIGTRVDIVDDAIFYSGQSNTMSISSSFTRVSLIAKRPLES